MIRRQLGRSGLELGGLGLGCWAIGGPFWAGAQPLGWGEVDDRESARAIGAAVDLGVTFFDTADVYGAGHSERVLGAALRKVRDRVIIATKFGNVFDEPTRQVTGADASPQAVRAALEASLRRLNTDWIDLYQFHLSDYDPALAVEVRETLEELVKEGLIRAYAWSTDDPERAAVFAQGPHCVAVQHELNVFHDAPEMLSLCEQRNLTSLGRSPLAMGLLSGKFTATSRLPEDDVRGRQPEWLRFFADGRPTPEWLARMDAVRDILTSGGRTAAQGALAWIWARSGQTLPIPGFRTVAQVRENVGALERGPLAPEQLRQLHPLLPQAVQERTLP